MIKEYSCGLDFLTENKDFLFSNKYLSCFIVMDAPLIEKVGDEDYCFKVERDDKRLLVLRHHRYNMMAFGDFSLVGEMVEYILKNNYKMGALSADEKIGSSFIEEVKKQANKRYREELGMDYMQAKCITAPTSQEIIKGEKGDVEEIYSHMLAFIKDCGLSDVVVYEEVEKDIAAYRYIKKDGKIVSMAKICLNTPESLRISDVYTLPEYRGKGYARKVVNACKNEILNKGLVATLNVDKKNPVSNHLYSSLGFEKMFSHGNYIEVTE